MTHAVVALLFTCALLADEKERKPSPRPTPSRPANEQRHAGGERPAAERRAPERHAPDRPPQDHRAMPQQRTSAPPQAQAPVPAASQPNRSSGSSSGYNPGAARDRGSYTPRTQPPSGRTMERGNHDVAVRSNGRTSEIRSRDMVIRRGPQGSEMRRAVVERDGRVYSFNRAGYGHVRNSYSYGGREYVVRRYYVGGTAFPRYYRPHAYRGLYFDAYTPAAYYSPYYYGWAYRPWSAPVVFSWGWGRSPWYGYYGGYFTPYTAYPSANLWLTDYIVAQTLEASYRERMESARAAQMQYDNQPPPQYAALTPDIKQQIAEEVQRQLSYEAAEAQRYQGQNVPAQDASYTGVGRLIEDNKNHVLLSNANIDVTTLNGQECAISQGDAIAVEPGQSAGQSDTVRVRVLASAGGGCPANSVVTISLQDLQEMVNHVRATIDSGLAAMQKDPSLPKPPPSVPTGTVQSDFAGAAPPSDPNEAAELQRLNQEANVTEQSVVRGTSYGDPAPASTDLQLGMSPEEAIQKLGKPTNSIRAGARQILMYQNLKLVFDNGRLAEIQ